MAASGEAGGGANGGSSDRFTREMLLTSTLGTGKKLSHLNANWEANKVYFPRKILWLVASH